MHKLFLYKKQKIKAQAMVEFALVLPILLLILFGMMETGRLLFIYASTVSAARQAARYASATGINPVNSKPYYKDCAGIQSAADRLSFLVNFTSVEVGYDGGPINASGGVNTADTSYRPYVNATASTCGSTIIADNGDRVTVRVTAQWEPLVPLVPLRPFVITSTSERTILASVGVAVTGIPPTYAGVNGQAQLAMTSDVETYDSTTDVITYTYTITNVGNADLAGPFSVTDPNTQVTITCPASPASLAINATYVCTGTYNITQADLDAGSLTNQAVGMPNSTQASKTITAIQNGSMSFTKTVSPTSSTTDVTYTYIITNTGNVSLTSYSVTDDKLGAICSGGTLLPGGSAGPPSCSKDHTITAAEKGGELVNVATATTTYNSVSLGGMQTLTATASATVITTPIGLTMNGVLTTAGATSPVYSSQTQKITYTFFVKNNTATPVTLSSIAINSFTGLGVVPSTAACVASPTIAPNATLTCTATYNVVLADVDNLNAVSGTEIPISIAVTATASDGVTAFTSSTSASTNPERHPAVTLSVISSPSVATTLGMDVTYTYTITNTGNTTLSAPSGGFAVTDTKVTGITCNTPSASITPGGTKTCTGTHKITQADLDAGSVVGDATVSAVFGVVGVTPSYTATTQSITITATTAKLKLEISVPSTVVAGSSQSINYTYTVTNTGNSPLTGLAFSTGYKGSVPVCAATDLALGVATTCTGTYVTTAADVGLDVTNTATATATNAGTPPPATVSGTASVVVSVIAPSACILTHGPLDFATPFGMTISNLNDYPVTISQVYVEFDTAQGQKLEGLSLNGAAIWTGSLGASPQTISSGFTGSLTIPAGSTYMISASSWFKTYTQNGSERLIVSFASIGGFTCNPMDSSIATSIPDADLGITKTDNVPSVEMGLTTTYTIIVTNNGPDAMTGAKLSDPAVTGLFKTSIVCGTPPGVCATPPTINMLESGLFTIPTLLSGQTYAIKVTAGVTVGVTSVSNVATINVPTGATDSVTGNNSATDTDAVTNPAADLGIAKNDGVNTVGAGTSTIYTIRVTNNGPSAVTGAILTDSAATGLTKTTITCSPTTPGQCITPPTVAQLESGTFALPMLALNQFYEIAVTANVAAAVGSSVSNVASVAPPTGTIDNVPGNNSRTDTDTVTIVSADMAITKTDGISAIVSGTSTTYTITVTNNGPSPISGAVLSDPAVSGLPKTAVVCSATPGQCVTPPTVAQLESGSFALPGMSSGQTYQITVTASVTTAGSSITNTASIAVPSGVTDPSASNDTATDTNTVSHSSDLGITKTDGVTSVNSGASDPYIITVTNNGPSPVTGAILSDPAVTGLSKTAVVCSGAGQCVTPPTIAQLESGSFALPLLSSGQTYQITVTADVTSVSAPVSNVATIAVPSGTTDPASGNNSATDTNTVVPPSADMAVTKTDGVTSVNARANTTYTIRVTNNGASTVTGAILKDVAATGLSKTSIACSGTPGQCSTPPTVAQIESAGGFALPTLTTGQFYEITVLTNVTANSGSVTNTATISSSVSDPASGNNTATDTNTVVKHSDLGITKNDGLNSINAGNTFSYTIVISNSGDAANGAIFKDPAVTDLTIASVTCSLPTGSAACPLAGNTTVALLQGSGIVIPTLPSGGGMTFTVTGKFNEFAATLPVSKLNSATITPPSGMVDLNSANNTAADSDQVNSACFGNLLTLTAPATLNNSDNYTWTINNGTGITLTLTTIENTFSTGRLDRIYMPAATQILNVNGTSPSINGGSWSVSTGATTFKLLYTANPTTVTDLTLTFAQTGCSVSNP
jgi:uncharacterized repeat protein (TIGR01451 family)